MLIEQKLDVVVKTYGQITFCSLNDLTKFSQQEFLTFVAHDRVQ